MKTCEYLVGLDDEDEEGPRPCGKRSRFRVERLWMPGVSDADNNGWSPGEACEGHFADEVLSLADGDDVLMTVQVRWDEVAEVTSGD